MKNLIGNDWRDSSNLNVIEVKNPATGSLIDTIPNSTVDDVVLTVNLAKTAQIIEGRKRRFSKYFIRGKWESTKGINRRIRIFE